MCYMLRANYSPGRLFRVIPLAEGELSNGFRSVYKVGVVPKWFMSP